MTIRIDAAFSRCVTGARLVTTLAVLGGTLALAGLGSFGDLTAGPADSTSPSIVTVELSQPLADR